ncbi:hypothetical protein [Stutzerimonas tarimensis]|uniref:DUF1992 domain-containing protein n=1 Tax=Stutzerimonas tarimensis TaxID=1507735 RepID=A0ABV7T650_9GAMM
MSTLDQDIERRIAREVAAWQERVTSRGEPLQIDEGWLHTPEALRTPFAVLKSAGIPPAEVELFQQRSRLRERLEACVEDSERLTLQRELSGLEQALAFRLEALQRLGTG